MTTTITTTDLPMMLDFAAYLAAGRIAMHGWPDATTPRTERPVRFVPATRVPFGLCWGMVNKWAVQPSRIA